MAMLEVKDLQVFYGRIQAIKGISFEVNEGEIVTLIGANGAGKTTTMKTMSGVRPVSVGSIIFGAGSWTWSKWGNSGYAVSGKNWVLGGIVGALLSGLAVTIVNKLFTSAGA